MGSGFFSPINSFPLGYVTRRKEVEGLKMEQLSTSDKKLKNLSLFNFQKDVGLIIKRVLNLFYIISIVFLYPCNKGSIASGYFSKLLIILPLWLM